jgi:hypothetical protein
MKRFGVTISLLDDAAFTERAGTVGNPRGLDYIPGGALLGVAARELYPTLSQHEAWQVFHSGEVRFGCALPAGNGARTFPAPLSWHIEKNATYKKDGRVDSSRLRNGATRDSLLSDVQLKQVRGGYITSDGRLTEIALPLHMMTAIDSVTRRAAEGQLFGYQMIPEGTELLASVEADESIPEKTWSALKKVFSGEIRLGHSRSALGGARAAIVDDLPDVSHGDTTTTRLVLWLLSDLASLTPEGVATTQPRSEWLGLPPGTLDLHHTFLRVRRYSPWNGHRGRYDLERLVIGQGSVLVYELASPPTESLVPLLERGLGLYRQCGLGRVWANSRLLDGPEPVFDEQSRQTAAESGKLVARDDADQSDLVLWLEGKSRGRLAKSNRDATAETFANSIQEAYSRARALKALPRPPPIGPSPSQWGTVFQVARDGQGSIAAQLFHEPNAICRAESKGWSEEVSPSRPFVNWFRDELREQGIADTDWRTLQIVVRRALDIARKEHETR